MVAEGKLAMKKLRDNVITKVLLRRTKIERAADISLPPKIVRVRRDALDAREDDFYQALYTQSHAQFNTYVAAGTLLNNYAHVFDLLIRLRQAVDHPYLILYSKTSRNFNMDDAYAQPVVTVPALNKPEVDDADEDPCSFCKDTLEDPVVAECGHSFCRSCIKLYMSTIVADAAITCPSCDKALTIQVDEQVPDTKVEKLAKNRKGILSRLPSIDNFQSRYKICHLIVKIFTQIV